MTLTQKAWVFVSCPHMQQLTARLQVPLIFLVSFLPRFFSQETSERRAAAFSSAPRQSHNTNSGGHIGPSCRHVCSAAYLFKPAAGPGSPAQASPGASPACLKIHSHLRIKLLTLMLLVMLGPAPIFEPINLQELRNIGHVEYKKGGMRGRFRHDTGLFG